MGQNAVLQGLSEAATPHLTRLLQFWDFIGLPHEERKQVFGDKLPIIGFKVDPNLMRVRMSEESKLQLIMAIRDFALHGTRHVLRDFQHIAGYSTGHSMCTFPSPWSVCSPEGTPLGELGCGKGVDLGRRPSSSL